MTKYQKKNISKPELVSVHGGHTGQFCNHAKDTLEEVINRYIELGFSWVGITEHIYPISNELRYPDETASNLDSSFLAERFIEYIKTCRLLQKKYEHSIIIFTGFETETYTGYKEFLGSVIRTIQPDYVVGSVHHVPVYNVESNKIEDICIDYSKDYYKRAAELINQENNAFINQDKMEFINQGKMEFINQGKNFDKDSNILNKNLNFIKSYNLDSNLSSIDKLYCRYFDIQHEMLNAISPAVVGHFDLIRIFDEDYCERIKTPAVWQRIIRNLEVIKRKNLIMDFNLRALMKGASEPYISAPILAEAEKMGIKVLIGDDSHGVKDIGVNMEQGIDILMRAGATLP